MRIAAIAPTDAGLLSDFMTATDLDDGDPRCALDVGRLRALGVFASDARRDEMLVPV